MQKEMTVPSNLFDDEGHLAQVGWAKQLLLNYNRDKIQAGSLRVKEWDCYCIMNPEHFISLIISDVGYFGMATVEWKDYGLVKSCAGIGVRLFTRGSLNMPPTADAGDIVFTHGNTCVKFEHNESTGLNRILSFNFPGVKFQGKRGIKGTITLTQDPAMDTMVNVIPFKDPKQFVYVQKIVCMPATGTIQLGGDTYEFRGEEDNSWGALDWSRGVFPYRTTWWWAYASGKVNSKPFGFNIDYGFGTESSKSMIFFDGVGHHLDEVTYTWDDRDLTKPWTFTSNDGSVNMQLEPVFTSNSNLNLLVLKTGGFSVNGFYTGDVVLDDGTSLHINRSDNVFGSAEHFSHRW